MAYSRPT